MAAVPELRASTYFAPVYFLKAVSKSSTIFMTDCPSYARRISARPVVLMGVEDRGILYTVWVRVGDC